MLWHLSPCCLPLRRKLEFSEGQAPEVLGSWGLSALQSNSRMSGHALHKCGLFWQFPWSLSFSSVLLHLAHVTGHYPQVLPHQQASLGAVATVTDYQLCSSPCRTALKPEELAKRLAWVQGDTQKRWWPSYANMQ